MDPVIAKTADGQKMNDVFYAFYKGRGEGCDYTIGCNVLLDRLSATTMEGAIVEAVHEKSVYDPERVEKVTILRVVEEADCGDQIAAFQRERESREKAAARRAKEAEFERLKRELGR